MIQQIFCTGCGADGRLPLAVSFEQTYKVCPQCHHHSNCKFSYHFCTVECFLKWTNGRKGLPCTSCWRTGFAFGFQENGICKHCDGTKEITRNEIELVPV
jgi:hypothetical protein